MTVIRYQTTIILIFFKLLKRLRSTEALAHHKWKFRERFGLRIWSIIEFHTQNIFSKTICKIRKIRCFGSIKCGYLNKISRSSTTRKINLFGFLESLNLALWRSPLSKKILDVGMLAHKSRRILGHFYKDNITSSPYLHESPKIQPNLLFSCFSHPP